jgi:histone-arginine methyltransferase CARM1
MAAAAATAVCSTFKESDAVSRVLQAAFSDESFQDPKDGALSSLVKACRSAIEKCPDSENDREFEYTLCEVLNAIWSDAAWRGVWEAQGCSAELSGRCPLKRIIKDAKYPLSFGNKDTYAHRLRYFFQKFGKLSTHSMMLQDETRMNSFQRAFFENRSDFEGKVIMDVGSGSGILAFFAIQAGAAKVYCVEASPMAEVITQLAAANGWSDKIVVVHNILQDIRDEVPEKVDCIISETLGYFLFAERGLETMIAARERFLKPGGKLYPSAATLCVAPFSDGKLFDARMLESKVFWNSSSYYGVDLTCMRERAQLELFRRPLCDQFHPDQLKAEARVERFDFMTLRSEQLANIEIDFNFQALAASLIHGIAAWFEVHFEGTNCESILSTSPWDCLTHWWQSRVTLLEPLAVNKLQRITGGISFHEFGNSYRCNLVMEAGGAKREIDGVDLLDIDINHRRPTYKEKQIAADKEKGEKERAVRVIDWVCTAAPSTDTIELASDPLEERKAFLRSDENSMQARVQPTKEVKINGTRFVLIEDIDMLQEFSKVGADFKVVASTVDSVFMAPQAAPLTHLMEHVKSDKGIVLHHWMEYSAATIHMQDFILRTQNAGLPGALSRERLQGFDIDHLYTVFSTMRARTRQ